MKKSELRQIIREAVTKEWDMLFGDLAWEFKPTDSGDMEIDADEVYDRLSKKFELKLKTEAVIQPTTEYVKPTLDKIKNQLLSCTSEEQCDELLNSAFNEHFILIQFDDTPAEQGLNRRWGITTASSLPNDMSPTGAILRILLGKDFLSRVQAIKTDDDWNNFVKSFEGVVDHENIHMQQFQRMPKDAIDKIFGQGIDDPKKYLSTPQEIMSFAKQAVSEFEANGYNKEEILNRLRNPLSKTIEPTFEDSDVFWQYVYFFKPTDPTFKKFLRYMYDYLN